MLSALRRTLKALNGRPRRAGDSGLSHQRDRVHLHIGARFSEADRDPRHVHHPALPGVWDHQPRHFDRVREQAQFRLPRCRTRDADSST